MQSDPVVVNCSFQVYASLRKKIGFCFVIDLLE